VLRKLIGFGCDTDGRRRRSATAPLTAVRATFLVATVATLVERLGPLWLKGAAIEEPIEPDAIRDVTHP
jgi:hypothetical protein